MEKPVVSVIIPVYNGETYLKECLDSVIRQSFSHWEMICINDGSTDGSLRILEDFARMDDRIRVFSQENQGLSVTRNNGMQHAQGDYILFLDCDDRLRQDTLACLTERAIRDQLDILYFDGDIFFDDGFEAGEQFDGYRRLYHTKPPIPGTVSGAQMFRMLYESKSYRSSACLQLLRRAFLQETGIVFYPGILYEDNIFTLKTMLSAMRTGNYSESFYERRMRSDSIVTQSKDYRHLRSYVIAYTQVAAYAMDAKLPAGVMPGVSAQLCSLMAHAVAVFSSLDSRQLEDIVKMNPESSLILETVSVWTRADQHRKACRFCPLRIGGSVVRKVRKLAAMIKAEGFAQTLRFCVEKLFGTKA